jgi:hypothetical protein
MTEKQKHFIQWIEEMTGVGYKGEKPSEYINKNLPKAKHESYMRQLEYEAEMDSIDSRRNW